MALKSKVEQLLNVFLQERTDVFLVELKVSGSNDILVIIDGDNGVSLQDCLDASRAIENNLDREEEDFSLQVMSSGLSEPLRFPRQYKKNIGRDLKLLLNNDTEVSGELKTVDEEEIVLILRYRKPKEKGKGKMDVEEEKQIAYNEIKKALVQVKF